MRYSLVKEIYFSDMTLSAKETRKGDPMTWPIVANVKFLISSGFETYPSSSAHLSSPFWSTPVEKGPALTTLLPV